MSLFSVLALFLPGAAWGATADVEVVAVGDVHGDPAALLEALAGTGIADAFGRWAGGGRHLVQMGDLVDRGPRSREAVEIAIRLEAEAAAAGGRATFLLGNHEVMAMTGDLRYVHPDDTAAFRGEEPGAERARRRSRILALVRGEAPLVRSRFWTELAGEIDSDGFDRVFPPGTFGRLSAFSPSGRYGKWLLARPAIHREGKTIFLHAGLNPRYAAVPLEELDRRIRRDLAAYLEAAAELERLDVYDIAFGPLLLQEFIAAERKAGAPAAPLAASFGRLEAILRGPLFDEEGPLWDRTLALAGERALEPFAAALLGRHRADRIVVGHTVTDTRRIDLRLGGRVAVIDTGMNRAVYGGSPSALIIAPGGAVRPWMQEKPKRSP